MIEAEVLADRLQELAVRLRSVGGLTSDRFAAWEKATMPRLFETDDDDQEAAARAGRSERDETDRAGDAQAARYLSEWKVLIDRIASDAMRVDRLIGIANPPQPRRLAHGEKQAAQVAAEGLCVSCWRWGEESEIELRPEKNPDVPAKPYYKDLCRWCGSFKATHGQLPPAALVTKHHRVGEHVTTADVAKALGRTA